MQVKTESKNEAQQKLYSSTQNHGRASQKFPEEQKVSCRADFVFSVCCKEGMRWRGGRRVSGFQQSSYEEKWRPAEQQPTKLLLTTPP